MKKHRKAKQFLEKLSHTPIVSAVCNEVGISRQSISRWLKSDPEFKKQYEESMIQGTENVNDLAVSQTINKVKQGDTGMIKYWLSHNDDRFMKKPKNNMLDIDFFNSSQERRIDFLDIGESMLMKKILEGDLNAIIFALRHNSGRYHPMKPESPFLDMTDLSDPAVKNIVTEQLDSLSEKINEINAQFSNEDNDD
jgi:hypothetical protein